MKITIELDVPGITTPSPPEAFIVDAFCLTIRNNHATPITAVHIQANPDPVQVSYDGSGVTVKCDGEVVKDCCE